MLGTLADGIEAGQAPRVPAAAVQAAAPASAALAGEARTSAGAIDTEDGLARCMGKVELYRRLLGGFRDSEIRFEAAVGAALADGRWAEAIRRAHDLKGLSGTIGAHRLHATARALQEQLAAHDEAAAKTLLTQAVGELTEVLAEIDDMLDAPGMVKERRR
jgi:HPt (histidine-containing phosphotransfer) domain-containing protein